jgi:hypothetical protein
MVIRVPAMADREYDFIDIEYTVLDRYGFESGEPNDRFVEHIAGTIGARTGDGEPETIGSLALARIDLWEPGLDLLDLLDAESEEWPQYWVALRYQCVADADFRHVLICDRLEIAEPARGHRIGLHALARAIRTWGESALVVMLASPTIGEEIGADELRRGRAALTIYWGQLGLDVYEDDESGEDEAPLLVGDMTGRDLSERIVGLSDWPLPRV